MGTFYTKCLIENHIDRKKSIVVPKLLVDTGSEYTWIPENLLEKIAVAREKKDLVFVTANGQQVTRSVGFVTICLDKFFTIDEVVFGEEGDLLTSLKVMVVSTGLRLSRITQGILPVLMRRPVLLLGARTLEGLNLAVDSRQKKLVGAGPLPVA